VELKELAERANTSLDELISYLDSPAGKRLRKVLAVGIVVSVPIVMRIPGLRRSPVGKLVELTGGTTIVVKLAEWIRDWERERTEPAAT
jgi:hypothetical protein